MPERRKTPRAQCRLPCRIANGREQVRARIIDVSEGGLCLISPVSLEPKRELEVAIDVPGTGVSKVRVEVWHIRRETNRKNRSRVWIAGAMLLDADEAYAKLLKATGVAEPEVARPAATSAIESDPDPPLEEPDQVEAIETRVYRIHCKANGGPRSRVLSLAAESEEEARAFATRDLGTSWTVLEVREA